MRSWWRIFIQLQSLLIGLEGVSFVVTEEASAIVGLISAPESLRGGPPFVALAATGIGLGIAGGVLLIVANLGLLLRRPQWSRRAIDSAALTVPAIVMYGAFSLAVESRLQGLSMTYLASLFFATVCKVGVIVTVACWAHSATFAPQNVTATQRVP